MVQPERMGSSSTDCVLIAIIKSRLGWTDQEDELANPGLSRSVDSEAAEWYYGVVKGIIPEF